MFSNLFIGSTRSLAVKGHDIQGSPVKILTKIRVTLALNRLRFWGLRVTFENFLNFIRKLVKSNYNDVLR